MGKTLIYNQRQGLRKRGMKLPDGRGHNGGGRVRAALHDRTFHAVSREHLHRYVSEFEFRYNHRNLNNGQRTIAAIRAAESKRLMYKQPTDSM